LPLGKIARVHIGYLKSYEHVGMFNLSASNQCDRLWQGWETQTPTVDAFSSEHVSITASVVVQLRRVANTTAPPCVLSLVVLPQTRSGEHSVELLQLSVAL
jgi:hypothetical protein